MKYLLDGYETSRLRMRLVDEGDFKSWLAFFENPESFRYWTVDLQSPEIECRRWYDRQFWRYDHDLGGMNALIEKSSGLLAGHCGLLVQEVDKQRELEIGYSLLPSFWNKGLASEAATKVRDIAFERNFSASLISIISLPNLPSAKVATKNGMTVDKQTVYNNNPVNIFRITREKWQLTSKQ